MNASGAANIPIIATEGGGALTAYTEAQKATWITSGIDQVAAGQIHMYMVYEMVRHSPSGYSVLDASNVQQPGYTAFQTGTAKYRFKRSSVM